MTHLHQTNAPRFKGSPLFASLLFLIFGWGLMTQAFAQEKRTISGTVMATDDDRMMMGGNVLIKGTTRGSLTNEEGYFKLEANTGDVLVFSYVGYETREVEVTEATQQLDISLSVNIGVLDDVVIVGYGQQKRSNLTGAISSVQTENLTNRPVVRLDQALQGMSSGVMVSKGGGAPGAAPTIHIRGVGSIGNTDPLWIVDGVKMTPGSHFNLDDVESIEVLKDAASAAIYGAEAAHGVILVTTKRGRPGEPQISYRSSFAKVNPIRLPELLGSENFVRYKRESRLAAGQNPEPAWDNWEHDTDWLSAYYAGSGFSHYHDFSIGQGTERANYYLSMGYDDETGILIDNRFQRFSLRLNSDFHLTDWLTIGESVLLSRVNENPIDNFNEDYNGAIPYRSIPIMLIYDETNPAGGWGRAPVYFQGPNPVASQMQQMLQSESDIFAINSYAATRNFFGDYNATTLIADAWTADNPTNHPRNIASDPNGNFSRPSTYFIEDGSYLKLRNAQIGFNVPEEALKRVGGIGSVRCYVNGNNILTFTNYTGFDPEMAGANLSRGIGYGLYPATRTVGGGVDVQF